MQAVGGWGVALRSAASEGFPTAGGIIHKNNGVTENFAVGAQTEVESLPQLVITADNYRLDRYLRLSHSASGIALWPVARHCYTQCYKFIHIITYIRISFFD